MKNENLLLQINLYTDQIKVLKNLILIQEHNVRVNERPTTQYVGLFTSGNILPVIQYGGGQ